MSTTQAGTAPARAAAPGGDTGPEESLASERRTVLTASLIGTTIEWYDFFLFATAAAIVFPQVFYGDNDPTVAGLLSFATFAVGFLARPIGGLVFGHVGDRFGRRTTLIVTMAMTGISTALIGLLPGHDSIGVLAPVLLVVLRIVQGIAVGGEWGGAVLLAVEYAPPGRRGLYGSVPQIGLGLGLALGTGVFALLGVVMDDAAFTSWGWRIAFVASLLLVLVGLVVRLKVMETPAFRRVQQAAEVSRVPALDVLRDPPSRRNLGWTLMARWAEGASFNTWAVFAVSYTVDTLGMDRTQVLVVITLAALLEAAVVPLAGAWGDRIGRGRVFAAGSVLFGLGVFPGFLGLQTGDIVVVGLVTALMLGVAYGIMSGAESTLFAEVFPARTRYTGMSLAFQGGGIYASGFTPLVLGSLLAAGGGSPWLACGYLLLTAVVSTVGALRARPLEHL
ncbi:MFS transporter [Modestobacter sp. I12A-02628]|uniref:Putative proline/betaine transporter n=1 Tax=Goekera deserti TaxID=2497753 RepID=A0A7K3WA63_9ACTN|nr:MFS transporter [Goekera deserti]MPQ99202.1 MFS transporter [Goekera deserti]NDI47537.1 MFS transporter [Goekera deserti]NEL53348.1 MHS family MFS transporter [Goekera deserti]